MAENQISKLMQTDIPAPGMSNFHFEPINRTSFSPFYGYPVHVQEILPNTNVRMNVDAIIKAEPTLGSLYGTFRMSMQAYFVPSRLYCKELDQNTRMGLTNDILNEAKFPVIAQGAVFENIDELVAGNYRTALGGISWVNFEVDEYSNCIVPAGSLFDNLQMFPSEFDVFYTFDKQGAPGSSWDWFGSARGINAIPFVAYYDIYRNYYWNAQDHTDFFVGSENNTSTFLRDDYAWNSIAEFADYLVDLVYSREPNKGTNEFWDTASVWNIQATNTAGFNILEDVAVADFINSGFNSVPYSQSPSSNVVHSHYWRRTYDDDYFTSRLDKSSIDVIDNSSLVRVSDNSFNVRQLKLAQRNYRYGTKNNLTNANRYDDLLNVHYGAKLNRALNIPHFLGSVSSDFYFEDIYAQSGENLGERNGILNASLRTTDFVNFQAEEHGYLMVIFTLIPRIDYVGAYPKMYMKDTFADVYKPEYDAVGFQEITMAELAGPVRTTYSDIIIGMQPSWFEYMSTYNHIHGNFTLDEKKFNTITRRFDLDSLLVNGFSTYGEPWALNYLFKETANWKDNFNGQFLFKVDCYQPMSKQIVSFF